MNTSAESYLAQELAYERNPDVPWHEYTEKAREGFLDRARTLLNLMSLVKDYADACEAYGLTYADDSHGDINATRNACTAAERALTTKLKELI